MVLGKRPRFFNREPLKMLHQLGRFDRQRHRQVLGRMKRLPLSLADELSYLCAELSNRSCFVGLHVVSRAKLARKSGGSTRSTRILTVACATVETRQPPLLRRMNRFQEAAAVSIGQVNHDFQHQEIGSRHYVPRAATTQTTDQLLNNLQMQKHDLLRSNAGTDKQPRELLHFRGEIARTHDDKRTQ